MTNRLRFRSGQVQLRKFPVQSDTVVAAGDIVWLDGGVIRPAAEFPWDTDLATTQSAFAALFAGISHHSSISGETQPISVDVSPTSVYEVDVHPASYMVGDPLGPDESSGSLMSGQLEAAASANAIARAAEYVTDASSLRVTFASAFATGSSNVNAQVG